MKKLSLTLFSAVLMTGSISVTAFAQDAMMDKAKEKAKNIAVDSAKSEMKSKVKGADKAIDMGADMAKGDSMNEAAKKAVMDTAKSKTKGVTAKHMPAEMNTETIIMKAPEPIPAAAPLPAPNTNSGVPINCPSGTTGQPDGTCMITGNYSG